eukprot:2158360-Pyramimonas_sp.AAC.1
MSVDISPAGVPIGNREQTPDPCGRDGVAARTGRSALSFWSSKSTESISPSPTATHAIATAAGETSRPGEARENVGAHPGIPSEWAGANTNVPIPIALNGQFGQDSDGPI